MYLCKVVYIIWRGYMARKTQISRDVILDAAFKMLVRDGYASINITRLAKEIGCSTQPIAWHFGNMDGLREALLEYCLVFLKDRYIVDGENAASILERIAFQYVELAYDYPNLYKYLYMTEQEGRRIATVAHGLRADNQDKLMQMLQSEHSIGTEAAEKYLLNMQLYVHGISSFAAAKISFQSKEMLMQMIHEASDAFLKQLK